jgi:2-hydroxy-6-oxonona-2,4-dienedioate hydrolase
MTQLMSKDLPLEALNLLGDARTVFTKHGNVQTAWHIWGEGAPILMLHGASGSWAHWILNIRPLMDAGYMVLVPDMPGFGDSDAPESGEDIDALVAPLRHGLRELIDLRRYVLVGFSLGSIVASMLATEEMNAVRELILVAPPGLLPASMRLRIELSPWKHVEDPAVRKAINRKNLARLMLYRSESITSLAISLQIAHAQRDRLRRRRLARTEAPYELLAQVKCSVAAIYGDQDALFCKRFEAIRCRARKLKLRRLTLLPNAGHWVQFEDAEAFNRELLLMLGSSPG